MDEVLAELKQRIQSGSPTDLELSTIRVQPPLRAGDLASAQSELGFDLPPFLRAIYLEVSNGGVGPAYGLLSLRGDAVNEDGQDAVALYKAFRQPDSGDPHWRWPRGLLPVGHLGCAMYACVDCTQADAPVIWFEPNPHIDGELWDDSFFPWAPSLRGWLEAWVQGCDVFEYFFNDDAGVV